MICILHGYLLEGSGSNLWTRSVVESLCRQGETVHLMAQENHPERYPFIAEARRYLPGGAAETFYRREGAADGGACVLHKPALGDTLPVYVWDKYEEFSNVVPMVELPDAAIEDDLERNVAALLRIVGEHPVTVLQFDPEHRIGQRLDDATLDLDGPVLLRHALYALPDSVVPVSDCAHGGTPTDALGDCRTGGADALARASRVMRPQHDDRTARTPSATLPRRSGGDQTGPP